MRSAIFLLLLLMAVSAAPTFGQPTCLWDSSKGTYVAPQGYTHCKPPSSSSGSSGSTSSAGITNDFGLLGWLLGLDPASRMAAQQKAARKAAMIAELERQRQEAIQRQDAERAKRLEDIARRLQSGDLGLKGASNNDLQLKLSPTGPIRFGEYMSTPATQTTSAHLTLKTGDEATKSLQTPTTNASSAGVINPNQPPAFNADRPTTEIRELADMLSKLTPEQQQKLIAAIKAVSSADATSETAAAPQTNSDSTTSATEAQPLKLKLSTAQQSADALNAAAKDPNVTPEQLSQHAAKDFNNDPKVTPLSNTPQPNDGVSAADVKPSAGITDQSQIGNTELSRIMSKKIDVPPWRPEGWVVSASKGDSTLQFVDSARKTPGCDSPARQDALARLEAKSKQLAGVEVVINRLNASSPRLQAELAETAAEMERDRDAFVDAMLSKLTGQLFEARTLVKSPEFVRTAATLSEAKEFADKVDELSGKVQTIKNGSSEARAGLLKEILRETLDAVQPNRIAAIRKALGPTIEFATGWYDAAEIGINTIETFAKIVAHDLNVANLNREIDARNRALASVEPLHKQLSNDVDKLRHDPILAPCSAVKP